MWAQPPGAGLRVIDRETGQTAGAGATGHRGRRRRDPAAGRFQALSLPLLCSSGYPARAHGLASKGDPVHRGDRRAQESRPGAGEVLVVSAEPRLEIDHSNGRCCRDRARRGTQAEPAGSPRAGAAGNSRRKRPRPVHRRRGAAVEVASGEQALALCLPVPGASEDISPVCSPEHDEHSREGDDRPPDHDRHLLADRVGEQFRGRIG